MIDRELKFKKPFQISEKEKTKVLEALKKTLAPRENIIFAYLFGSFAEGLEFHDIDIALFGKERLALSDLIELSNLLESHINYPVDLVDFQALSPGFQMEIFSKGYLLISKDDNLRTDFIETACLRYREYAHFRNLCLGIEGTLY
jgi:predicted nucleotidyltransferase